MDNSFPVTSPARMPTFTRLLRWLFSRRAIRAGVFGLICLATLVALIYAVENWRGRRAFAGVKQEAEALGLKLDWDAVIPPMIADEQNAAAHPFLKPMLDFTRTPSGRVWNDANGHSRIELFRIDLVTNSLDQRVTRISLPSGTNTAVLSKSEESVPPRIWSLGAPKPTPWTEWQAYYRAGTNYPVPETPGAPAADVLFALRKFDQEFALLAEAVQRPLARYAVKYDEPNPAGILLPHLAQIKSMIQALRLRSAARLEVGDTAGAHADTMTGLRLAATLREEPLLISYLVRLACIGIMEGTVAEGIARHQWTPEQLQALQEQFQQMDLLRHCWLSLRGEMVGFGVRLIDYFETHRGDVETVFGPPAEEGGEMPAPCQNIKWRLMPAGWFEQNKSSILRAHLSYTLPQLDVAHHRIKLAPAAEGDAVWKQLPSGPYAVFVRLLLPALDSTFRKCARAQATADQAGMACALERFRLENKRYPDSLDQLAPKYLAQLPLDVITGAPQKYHPTVEGGYVLYSVGRDGKDDGGSTTKVEREPLDWVWSLPRF
jgi:hypothetical protein